MDEFRTNGIEAGGFLASSRPGLSGSGAGSPSTPSDFAQEMSGALDALSGLDNSEKLREDAIQNAKAIIKNWTPPSESQIGVIFQKMRDELMA